MAAKAGTRGAVSSGGAGPVRKGQAGENAVRAQYDIGTKTPVRVNGRNRIPDGITKDAVHEVKNKSYVSNSQQIRDYIDIAKQKGRGFNLYVPKGARVSNSIEKYADDAAVGMKTYEF